MGSGSEGARALAASVPLVVHVLDGYASSLAVRSAQIASHLDMLMPLVARLVGCASPVVRAAVARLEGGWSRPWQYQRVDARAECGL